eukprot:TRINITY_DN8387_c0_g1_i1.p1 TRINITY_DN8387_c0_g1~~TRINITY_DN8387_c0_g1_i1.p1  ORF type:complete len:134 (-),score=41.71 TRINITY_DN8387_c0_g1_i1:69-470(-)
MASDQPKSILKTGNEEPRNLNILWDEDNLIETSLLRGTRMKIDEPDTPFEYLIPSSEEDSQEEDVNVSFDSALSKKSTKFAELKEVLLADQKKQEAGETVVDNAAAEKEKKRKAFEAKRKAHYNEGNVLRNRD